MGRLRLKRFPFVLLCAASLAFLLAGSFHPQLVSAQEVSPTPNPMAAITAPESGQTIRGQVSISGSAALSGFAAYEVAFAYADNATGTWFTIQRGESAVTDGVLAVWDTNAITDGRYDLRLVVYLTSGDMREHIIRNIDVRNYTPTEAPTARPTIPPTYTPVPIIPTATLTPTNTPQPTPTALPPNPAGVDTQKITTNMAYGALGAVGLFILFGLVMSLRRGR